MSDEDIFNEGRSKIKRRVRNLNVVLFSLIPVLGYVIYVGELNKYVVALIVLWGVLFFLFFWMVFLSNCPRCGALVFMRSLFSFRLKKCPKCGLELDN